MWMEIEQLRGATVRELRIKYLELFGEPSRSNHKQFLFRRIAWRLQALTYGDLSEQARQRALALAQDADLRIKAPPHLVGAAPQLLLPTLRSRGKPGRDQRLPPSGSVLQREQSAGGDRPWNEAGGPAPSAGPDAGTPSATSSGAPGATTGGPEHAVGGSDQYTVTESLQPAEVNTGGKWRPAVTGEVLTSAYIDDSGDDPG